MEWRFGTSIEDLVVPKDEEIFDCLSSPDGWNLWGKKVDNHNSRNKLTAAEVEECLFGGAGGATFYTDIEQLSAPKHHSAYPHDYSDFHVNDFSRFSEADDDIFLQSLLKGDASEIQEADNSANIAQTSRYDVLSGVNILGGASYSQDCTNNDADDYPYPEANDPEMEICVSVDPSNVCESTDEEEICLEESVLHELQRSMFRLAEDTRSCFRDSLYRLAENTRQQVSCSQDTLEALEDCNPTASSAPSRLEETDTKLPNTNAIDRTVATLLFNTMNSSYQPNSSISSYCSGDAEVPTFGSTCQPMQP